METKMLQLCYSPVENKNGYFLNGVYCSDMNMIYRIGEWLSIMNEIDHFYVVDMTTNQGVAVDLEMPEDEVITASELNK